MIIAILITLFTFITGFFVGLFFRAKTIKSIIDERDAFKTLAEESLRNKLKDAYERNRDSVKMTKFKLHDN